MRRVQAATILVVSTLSASAQIPAFPGAEGFGAYATGGRGGDVYYVTNLNNSGAGTLREGLNTAPASGRTIIFAVSGYIPVNSDTNFNVPSNVTIAGQTAPGDGVGLRGGRMLISGNNSVMRHFRIRHGRNGTGGDCLNIDTGAHTTMLDHISMMFSTDENFSFFGGNVNNFTMQNSSSTWGMERHNAGGLWDLNNGSCIDSLWAHHRTRNPKARPNGVLEWVNNVTFHWRNEGFIMGDSQTPANWKTNAIGNYYISIDDPDEGFGIKSTAFTKALVATDGKPNFSLYLEDTYLDNNDNGIVDGADLGYAIVSGSEFTSGDAVGSARYYKPATPFTGATGAAAVTIDDATTAYKKVMSSVGPLRLDANHAGPLRDELDSLLIDSVVNQYSVLVQKDSKVAGEDPNRPNNGEQHLADAYGITNNGFGTLNGTTAPADVDLDGLPDVWEFSLDGKNGLSYNPGSANNNDVFPAAAIPGTFFPSGTPAGYTFLEEYLHFKAVPHAMMEKSTAALPSVQTIDLARYTDGFTNSPVYTVSNVRNGTVQQFLADGVTPAANGPIARFTPTQGFVGRAGFDFNVTDAEGSSWTQQFALLVTTEDPRLLVNGGFDGSDGSAAINGWTDSAPTSPGFWLQDGSGGSPGDPTEPEGGSLYLTANRLAGGAGSQPSASTLSQTVTLQGENLSNAQSGSALFDMTFYHHDADPNDTGIVTVRFLNASSSIVGTLTTGALPDTGGYDPVTRPWKPIALRGVIPSTTTAFRVEISTSRAGSGTATNVHFDSFVAEISSDSDADGLPDTYEQTIIDADPDDEITSLADIAGPAEAPIRTDYDNDGSSDAEEYAGLTDPLDPDSDGDGFEDGLEVVSGSDPRLASSTPGTSIGMVNGGFENPVLTTNTSGAPVSGGTVPGWQTVLNEMWVLGTFTFTDNSNPAVANEGSQFLTSERRAPDPDAAATAFTGGNSATMTIRQDIDVTSLAGGIDAGGRTIFVGFDWFDVDIYDRGNVTARFLNASGEDLGRGGSFVTMGNPSGWQTSRLTLYPPAGTRTVRITVTAENLNDAGQVVGSTTVRNIHFDDFSVKMVHADGDSDGMSDYWEWEHGLNFRNPADAQGHADADTLTNLQEFLAGTNPNLNDTDEDGFNDAIELAGGSDPLDAASKPTSLPKIPVAQAMGFRAGGGFEVLGSDLSPTLTYRLLRSSDLLGFNQEVDRIQADNPSEIFTDATPPAGSAFYIIELVQP